jgi:hypothetical protein
MLNRVVFRPAHQCTNLRNKVRGQQIAANRRNALYSRGPKTAEGRARSRRNALKHGLTARSLILEGERAAQYEAFRTDMNFNWMGDTPIRPHPLHAVSRRDLMVGTPSGPRSWRPHQQQERNDTCGL